MTLVTWRARDAGARRPPSAGGTCHHEATTHLSRLLDDLLVGEDVVIERRRRPVARLVRVAGGPAPVFGSDRDRVVVGSDFDAALPDDVAAALGAA